MLLNASGFVDTQNITKAVAALAKQYQPLSLPICVDFDSVYDQSCPAKYVPRSNVDNVAENTFYITTPEQALLNQSKLGQLGKDGKYFSILPCRSLDIEDTNSYATNLTVEIFHIGKSHISEMLTEIKAFLVSLGLTSRNIDYVLSEDRKNSVDILVNLVSVGSVSVVELADGRLATRGTMVKEPVLSKAIRGTL